MTDFSPLSASKFSRPCSWWIDEPHILGSKNPTDADLEQLRHEGFGILVSLLREDEQAPNYVIANTAAMGYRRYNIPVEDYSPPTVAQLEEFLELVNSAAGGSEADDSIDSGSKIIVHCQGGIGRTGTFAAAYWITKGLTAQEAIAHVRKARPHAVETPAQEEILAEFERRMFERGT